MFNLDWAYVTALQGVKVPKMPNFEVILWRYVFDQSNNFYRIGRCTHKLSRTKISRWIEPWGALHERRKVNVGLSPGGPP